MSDPKTDKLGCEDCGAPRWGTSNRCARCGVIDVNRISKNRCSPYDATARYRDHNKRVTWLKDLDESRPGYPMARLWSDVQGKWSFDAGQDRGAKLLFEAIGGHAGNS